MNEAERQLIAGLFERIRSVETARRDPDAEDFIAGEVARQPHAPYAMAQTIVVQDRTLEAAQARIAELERELAEAREQAEAPASFSEPQRPSQGAASPWGPRAQETMARAEAARTGGASSGPWGGADQQPASPPYGAPQTGGRALDYGPTPPYGTSQPRAEEPSRGGGFLSGALQTAAGVAAGALLFQGARSLFGGDEEKAHGAGDAARPSEAAGTGDAGSTGDIGDWFSNTFGGSGDDRQPNEDRSAGLFDAGDDDGADDDWA